MLEGRLDSFARAVVAALREPRPAYHEFMWRKLQREWPTLAVAVEDFVAEFEERDREFRQKNRMHVR
jgi:hypothetical protein